jgi:hypothetical protein
MILHEVRKWPPSWSNVFTHVKRRWVAFLLSNCSFLEVLEYFGSLLGAGSGHLILVSPATASNKGIIRPGR